MTTQTKPSAGAMRAAEVILAGPSFYLTKPEHMAALIDSESGLVDLVRASEAMLNVNNPPAGEPNHIDFAQAAGMLEEALAKVKNPNAEVKQAYPRGRWS